MTRIEKYDLFFVQPRWLFLRLQTSDGIVGWGEPILESRAKTVAAAVRELMDTYVLHMDVSRIEDVWQVLYRSACYLGGPILMSALSGIDQALWDIKGKELNAPVHALLGGAVRDKVRIYTWIGGDEPEDTEQVIEDAHDRLSAGYTALKMNVAGKLLELEHPSKIREISDRFARIREAIGEDIDLAVDFHGRVSRGLAPLLADALAPHDLFFIEEPVRYNDLHSLALMKSKTHVPIATGEKLFSRWDFLPYFEQGAVDIIQPDLSHAGGITECKKIASCAETYGISVAFHCPLGPIALASGLQVAATLSNFLIQEASLGMHYNKEVELLDYVANKDELSHKSGYINVPQGPGLGVEIDEAAVKDAARTPHDWKGPLWRHSDGSFAHW